MKSRNQKIYKCDFNFNSLLTEDIYYALQERGYQVEASIGSSGYPIELAVIKLICRRLVGDWENLADYFDIPIYERYGFEPGKQPHRVWEWLELRNKLHELEAALNTIGRGDLVDELNK